MLQLDPRGTVRSEKTSRVDDIDSEIEDIRKKARELESRLESLLVERKKLTAPVKGRDYGFLPQEDRNLNLLFEFIRKNPGAGRSEIATVFPQLDMKDLSNLLLKARRNRGLILNRGSRTDPSWYVSEEVDQEEI